MSEDEPVEYPYCHNCGCECTLNFHEYCAECGHVPEFIKTTTFKHRAEKAEAELNKFHAFLNYIEESEEWDKTWNQIMSEWEAER